MLFPIKVVTHLLSNPVLKCKCTQSFVYMVMRTKKVKYNITVFAICLPFYFVFSDFQPYKNAVVCRQASLGHSITHGFSN